MRRAIRSTALVLAAVAGLVAFTATGARADDCWDRAHHGYVTHHGAYQHPHGSRWRITPLRVPSVRVRPLHHQRARPAPVERGFGFAGLQRLHGVGCGFAHVFRPFLGYGIHSHARAALVRDTNVPIGETQ